MSSVVPFSSTECAVTRAGKCAPSKMASTIPATKAPQLSDDMSGGTEMNRLTTRSRSEMRYLEKTEPD